MLIFPAFLAPRRRQAEDRSTMQPYRKVISGAAIIFPVQRPIPMLFSAARSLLPLPASLVRSNQHDCDALENFPWSLVIQTPTSPPPLRNYKTTSHGLKTDSSRDTFASNTLLFCRPSPLFVAANTSACQPERCPLTTAVFTLARLGMPTSPRARRRSSQPQSPPPAGGTAQA